MGAKIRSNFFISKAERSELQKQARKRGISSAELLRRVLDAFLGIPEASVEPVKFKTQPK